MWKRPSSEKQLLSRLVKQLRGRLPSSWEVRLAGEVDGGHGRPDALLEIRAPNGARAAVTVEVKSRVEPKDVYRVAEQLRRYTACEASLLVAPFLSPRTRELLAAAGISYGDSTGNLRLTIDSPALIIELSGATSSPWREDRPLKSLKGRAARRVVRALCDLRPPYSLWALAERCAAPVASVWRVVHLLDREALITRDPRGPVTHVQWSQLIRRWAQDYS